MSHLHSYWIFPWGIRRGWNVDCGSSMCSSKAAGALFHIFPSVSSAKIASGCFLPERGHELHALSFWSRLRSHQLTWQQKGWQPVKIPGASLLHPVSVCWTKWWHEALVDGTHQVSMYFFNLGRKQISWPWLHSRETGRMLIIGYKRVTLLRLFCLHALWPDHILALRQWLAVMLKEGQAQLCVLVDPHLYIWKVTHTGSSDLVLNTFCPYSLGRYNIEEAYPAFKTMSYPAISMPYPYSTGDS